MKDEISFTVLYQHHHKTFSELQKEMIESGKVTDRRIVKISCEKMFEPFGRVVTTTCGESNSETKIRKKAIEYNEPINRVRRIKSIKRIHV